MLAHVSKVFLQIALLVVCSAAFPMDDTSEDLFVTILARGANVTDNMERAGEVYTSALVRLTARTDKKSIKKSVELLNYYHGESGYVETMISCRGREALNDLKRLAMAKRPSCMFRDHLIRKNGKIPSAICYTTDEWPEQVKQIERIANTIEKREAGGGSCVLQRPGP